jgi:enoyl-[acyl-carrier protein] reductase I
VHCLAFAGKEELIGDYSAISPEGFARALEVSAYSLAPLCRWAKPLFNGGGSVITLSYLGAERAIPNYNVMGVAKAALEASVRYLAAELGPEKQVRVNAISAGPIRTLASSAIGGILDMIHNVEEKAPLRRTVTQEEVGGTAAFLASPLASGITGQVIYVDGAPQVTGEAGRGEHVALRPGEGHHGAAIGGSVHLLLEGRGDLRLGQKSY